MSITREEAIRRFEKQLTDARCVLDSGFGTNPGESDTLYRKRKEMAEIALQALREQEEREDPKPLTIEELQQMHGQPVWIEDEKAWGIINAYDFGTWKEKPFVTFYYKSVRCEWDIERRGLKCYRHKPKGE